MSPVTNPAVMINHYLAYQVKEILGNYFGMPMFFLPSTPTDIQSLYEGFPAASEDQPFAVYERMFKMRKGSFPHCKCEQLLYYIYKNGSLSDAEQAAVLFETTQLIYDLMDRGDESAQEVNAWQIASLNSNGKYQPVENGTEFNPVFFHETKVFQLEETRDIIDFATAKTYFGNKIIVDYEYHAQDFNNAKPTTKNILDAVWAGAWNSSATYDLLDVVSYSNNNWLAVEENTNQAPPDSLSWRKIVTEFNTNNIPRSITVQNVPPID